MNVPRVAFGYLAIALLAASAVGCGDTATPAVTRRWLAHVDHLASDEMRGRLTGTPEHRRAAEYVAKQLEKLGLEPGVGAGGSLQAVPFVSRRVRESECSLELAFGDRVEALVLGEDATLSMASESAPSLEAPAVFVGYGISVPEQGHDDLSGADLTGKIAVYLQGGPASVSEPRRSHAQYSGERWARLRAAGAVGVVAIQNPHHADIPWVRGATQRFAPGMGLADSALDERAGQRLSASVNPERAEKWFRDAPYRFADLLTLADSQRALPVFPLTPRVRARVRFDREVIESHNVVAVLPGREAALRDEYVVLTAHLDHLGVGAPVAGDSIYNGAMDNASGVATLLEVARSLALQSKRPARSVAFVLVTGEEKGLLGSYYFAHRPTMPAGSIVANLNVDMVLPIVPFTQMVLHGVDESDLGDHARRLADDLGIRILPDPEPQRVVFVRSDQFNFIRTGIPALAPSAGAPPGTPEADSLRAWRKANYHAPSDGLGQPIDPKAPADLVRFVTRLTTDVANAPERPRWKETSFFKRFADVDRR
jgi:hypothetical protein